MTELVFLQNEQAVTTSLKVAEVFGKNHQHVIRDVRGLITEIEDVSKIGQMFSESSYPDKYGRQQPMYLMNRDGFTLLVMGFTGKKALKFRLNYLEAFNAMEKQLIDLLVERKNEEWREIRRTGKRGNQTMTKVIQQVLIPLAREQGATAEDKFFYMNYQRAVNKAAGIKPKTRDELSIEQLYEVSKIQDIMSISIKGLAAKGTDYHKIYSDSKKTAENYSRLSFINQRFIA